MAKTPEGAVKAKIKLVLEELGAWYFCPSANGYGRVGIPDFVGCLNGLLIAIEAKAGKGKTTALQERELKRIREVGGYAIVVNEENIGDLKGMIEDQMRRDWVL